MPGQSESAPLAVRATPDEIASRPTPAAGECSGAAASRMGAIDRVHGVCRPLRKVHQLPKIARPVRENRACFELIERDPPFSQNGPENPQIQLAELRLRGLPECSAKVHPTDWGASALHTTCRRIRVRRELWGAHALQNGV